MVAVCLTLIITRLRGARAKTIHYNRDGLMMLLYRIII